MAGTFVLVPGSFVVPEEYNKVEALLQKQGRKTKTIDLLSANNGTRMPPATTEDDTDHVRSGILAMLDRQDLCHQCGPMPPFLRWYS